MDVMATVKLGFAPTRRSIFSAPDAIKYRNLTADRLEELGISFVDITDMNEEGLLSGPDLGAQGRAAGRKWNSPAGQSMRSLCNRKGAEKI